MIIMIDNYDSFTYNLVQYLGEMGQKLMVFRNDAISVRKLAALRPERIVISPGPGKPHDAGISCDVIKYFAPQVPVLGVCLGHQCIAEVFGGKVVKADRLMHGKTSLVHHNEKDIFTGIENPCEATRYHSLLVERASLPDELDITAVTDEQEIMGLKHRDYAVWGVQFHPESILTGAGKKLLENFIKL